MPPHRSLDSAAQNRPPSAPESCVSGLVSILVPLYNEEEFIGALLQRVLAAPLADGLDRELVIVDDCSTDGSREIAEEFAARYPGVVRLIPHRRNGGKGAAVQTAIQHARGEFAIIQDADLEYDPNDYPSLLRPLVERKADAVFGSRFMNIGERRVLYYWHSIANALLTHLSNVVSDLNLTDMETCYKAFRTSLLKSIPLRSTRFGIEPELTIKLGKRRVRVYETPISYHGRTYEEGKKIGLRDAFEAVWVILRCAFTSDIYKDSGPETLHALEGARNFNRWMADTIRPYIGDRVFEIGAGIGNLTHALVPKRTLYVASDIDEEHLARLTTRFQHRPNLLVRHCDLANSEHFASLQGEIDTVVCLNVVEHIEDDLGALRNIHAVLDTGGRAIVLVPQGQDIYGTLDEALGHYRRYSIPELRQKMEAAGFHVEQILEFNRVSRPGWYVSGRILKSTALSPRGMALFDRFVWLWRRLDGVLPWPATSIIAIGSK
ncbi:MAG TPA: bifunctional glycosyltransferase/class I SAM-dependent methyltransferase [Bryobacteraceae bacterium]|nr:bifunctional glycosyltransferase/class I SAM-dependent methyltransferase [Bryobacteraceae bacterium]